MVVKTAVRRPIHILDIDNKVRAMATFKPYLDKGEVTVKELGEDIHEDGFAMRVKSLLQNDKVAKPPKGWATIANYVEGLENDPQAKAAGTILWDSFTLTVPHIRAHMNFVGGRNKFVWDDWSAWLQMWTEITDTMCNYAMAYNKDFIITIHERVNERPGERTKGVEVKEMLTVQGVPVKTRTYLGIQDILIAGAIPGQFGLQYAAHFTDVYALKVDVDDEDHPKWRCRVLPDGLRDLRCSFDVKGQAEWDPDFRQIWGVMPQPRKEVTKK